MGSCSTASGFPGSTLNFVWIMAEHREVVDRKWGVVQVDPRYG
jgi:5-deoxy-glucuronate isomerase